MKVSLSSIEVKKTVQKLRENGIQNKIHLRDIREKHPNISNSILATTLFKPNTENPICIGINTSFSEDIQTSSTIHELLHIISMTEGWPLIKYKRNISLTKNEIEFLDKYEGEISSIFQHPYVFSRMINDYNLNHEEYFNIQVNIFKKHLIKSIKKFNNSIERTQTDIFSAVNYFHYPEQQKKDILDFYRTTNFQAYKINRDVEKKITWNTAEDARKAFSIYKKEVLNIGKKKKSRDNHLFELLSAQ